VSELANSFTNGARYLSVIMAGGIIMHLPRRDSGENQLWLKQCFSHALEQSI
jgi:hypothetical protein